MLRRIAWTPNRGLYVLAGGAPGLLDHGGKAGLNTWRLFGAPGAGSRQALSTGPASCANSPFGAPRPAGLPLRAGGWVAGMIHFRPDPDRFKKLAARHTLVPVYCEILSDQLTPVSAFQRLASRSGHAFLLESVIGGEKIARYSFIGADPSAIFEAFGQPDRFDSRRGDGDGRAVRSARAVAGAAGRAPSGPSCPSCRGSSVGRWDTRATT